MADLVSTKTYAAVCPSMLAGLIVPMLSMEMISPGKRSGFGMCGASFVSVSLSLSEGASGGSDFGSLLYIGGGRSCGSGLSVEGFGQWQ